MKRLSAAERMRLDQAINRKHRALRSRYRRYNIIDMEVIKEATAKIEEHQRALKSQNSHRTAIVSSETGVDDKTDPVN